MNTRVLPLPGLRTGRRDRRATRRTPLRDTEGTSLGRLLGIAMLGWFGLMLVVAAIAL